MTNGKMLPMLRTAMIIAVAIPVCAQTKLSGPTQIEARRAELAQIQEQLADSDPLKRQAAITTIVESRDATKIDFALRIALVSDDAGVRSIALRAYMANLKELHFEVQSPPDIQRQVEAALNGDGRQLTDLMNRYPYLRNVAAFSYQVLFKLKNYDMSSNTGEASINNPEHVTTFTVTGDRVSGTGFGFWVIPCKFEFQPQRIVRDGPPVLKGTLVCNDGSPRLTIAAPMF
jgi:hypothetical protein